MEVNHWGSYDPFYDVRNIHSQVDNIFNGFLGSQEKGRSKQQQQQQQQPGWLPVVDVKESETCITIYAELPGIKKEDIHVDVTDGILTLSGEKKPLKAEENERYNRVERTYGKFTRSFALPKGADPSQISAAFTDGVLELSVPKPVVKEPVRKKIEIK